MVTFILALLVYLSSQTFKKKKLQNDNKTTDLIFVHRTHALTVIKRFVGGTTSTERFAFVTIKLSLGRMFDSVMYPNTSLHYQ